MPLFYKAFHTIAFSLPDACVCSDWLSALGAVTQPSFAIEDVVQVEQLLLQPCIEQHCTNMNNYTHLVEFDDMRVVKQLHYLHLSVYFLQVGGVQSGLINDFNGHLKKKDKL